MLRNISQCIWNIYKSWQQRTLCSSAHCLHVLELQSCVIPSSNPVILSWYKVGSLHSPPGTCATAWHCGWRSFLDWYVLLGATLPPISWLDFMCRWFILVYHGVLCYRVSDPHYVVQTSAWQYYGLYPLGRLWHGCEQTSESDRHKYTSILRVSCHTNTVEKWQNLWGIYIYTLPPTGQIHSPQLLLSWTIYSWIFFVPYSCSYEATASSASIERECPISHTLEWNGPGTTR